MSMANALPAADRPATSQAPTLSLRGRAIIAGAFFVAALVHANLWGAFIPLWQIPDEAAHYEYVRLMVEKGRPPTTADTDLALQSQMLRSMWENHYWEYLGYRRPDQPPTRILPGGWTSGGAVPDTAVIGDAFVYAFSQLQNTTPVYYAMLAPVQALVINQPIDNQLQTLRFVSRFIFAVGVVLIVLTAGELFNWNLPLVVGAGLISVLQPMFVYIGSGVNNDNGVMLFVALLAWQLAAGWRRGWRRGYPWWRIGLIVLAGVLALLSKRTGVFALAWAPWVIGVWGLLRLRRQTAIRIVGAGVAVAGLVVVVSALLYQVPTSIPVNWTSSAGKPGWSDQEAHTGSHAFVVQSERDNQPTALSLYAPVRVPIGSVQPGTSMIWSAWVKGPAGSRGMLRLQDNNFVKSETDFEGTGAWTPISVTHPLTSTTYSFSLSMVGLSPEPVYFDDLTLTLGQTRTLGIPNNSAEEPKRLLADIITRIGRVLGVGSHAERLVRDYRANLAAVAGQVEQAVRIITWTYWGRFGIFARAPNPALPQPYYPPLLIVMGLAVVSTCVQPVLKRAANTQARWLPVLFLIGVLILLVQTFMPLLVFATLRSWYPQGRYLYSGMALIVGVLAYGWIGPWPGKWKWVATALTTIGLGLITLVAAQACLQYFHG